MLGRFFQALLATGHRTHLTRQAHLAKHQQALGQRPVAQTGHDRRHQGQVRGRFQHLDPAHHVEEHILVVGGDTAMAVQYRQQHRQTVWVQAQGDPPRVGQVAVVDQRLHFHQHRPRTLPRGHDHTARNFFLGTVEEYRRRVGDLLEPSVGHAEHAQFVDRAETVLDRPQQPQAAIGFAFEIQHGIDHVLKHPRACQRAFLGHMAHQEDRRAALFGVAHQQGRAFTYLGNTARCRLQLFGKDGLDRVDDHDLGFFHLGRGDDAFDAGLGHHPQLVLGQAQPARAHGDLLLRFFAGDVQRRHARGNVAQGLQENGRLADARIATDQYHRAIDQPTAQHPVQFGAGSGKARDFLDTDFSQGLDLRLLPGPTGAATGWRGGATFDHGFDQGIPGTAFATLAGPFGEGRATLGAAVHALGLGHFNTCLQKLA
ncbi:hypothetical protein D9M71_154440 [compost metagenome]